MTTHFVDKTDVKANELVIKPAMKNILYSVSCNTAERTRYDQGQPNSDESCASKGNIQCPYIIHSLLHYLPREQFIKNFCKF